MITEFNCQIAQSVVDDLQYRIRQTRWPDEIDHSGWQYGASLSYLKELADYWLHQFDWRKVEEEINQYPNYIAEIDGNQKSVELWYASEGAYSHQHRTKPLTLSYALNDSPIGLCAWIVEKYHGWSDCKGDIESVFTKEELLSTISLYWFTESIHSSIRLYKEASRAPLHFSKNDFITVPVGIAKFHKEEPFPPRRFIERGYNIQHWTDIPEGGHFAAMEQPVLLANDIRQFVKKLEFEDDKF